MSRGLTVVCYLAAAIALVQAEESWQAAVLCSSKATLGICSDREAFNAALLQKWKPQLNPSSLWGWQTTTSPSGTFTVLARHLKPTEANVQFAQAFCLSRGGQLAYWQSEAEYRELSRLVLELAKASKDQWHVFLGLVQRPGAKRADEGWVWVHNNAAPSAAFPWAAGEPNQHNAATQPGHTEDCAVVATYHGQKTVKLVDDFPCNYADSKGKYLFNGWNPKLSVACRLKA